MKKVLLTFVVLQLLIPLLGLPCFAAEESDTYISESGIYESARQLSEETKEFLNEIGLNEITTRSVTSLDFFGVIKTVFSSFKHAFSDCVKSISVIVGCVLVSALASALCSDKREEKLYHIFHPVSVLVVALSAALPLSKLIGEVTVSVQSAAAFSITAVPIMCVVCAAQGKTVTASLCSAGAVGISQMINTLFSTFFMPLSNILLALGIGASIDNSLHPERVVKVLRKYLLILLSACALLYFTVLSVRTSVSSAVDESTVKTIKFASSNFVPVIGGAISDSAAAVAASLSVTKSTIGVFGVMSVIAVFAPAFLKLFIWLAGLELSAVLAETFHLDSLKNSLKNLADALTVLVVIMFFCMMIFLINFGVLLGLRGPV
ncbi:MAG: hypothetical protein IJG23_02970 [Clostridia bacterium]|nr:hypothetical protein [Clostridia bacterium]